jgi:hypothetical protein
MHAAGGLANDLSIMPEQSTRRSPPPWKVERIDGGYVVKDANGQSLA